MREMLRRPVARIIAVIGVIVIVAVVGFAIYLASLTGSFPWQTDPTRIAVTPFADIPGFTAPAAIPTATP